MTVARSDFHLRPAAFTDLPGWYDDDQSSVLPALDECRRYLQTVKPYRTGSLGLMSDELVEALQSMPRTRSASREEARHFFENEFSPFYIEPVDGGQGLVTAFYEPTVEVSDHRSEVFRYPFYRPPADLIEVSESDRLQGWNPDYRFARKTAEGLSIYPDREAIDGGLLEGRNLEIGWAHSKVDVFFAHVQGAARLSFPHGRTQRITYAAKNGHPFSGIGRYLIDQGEIAEELISMQSIRKWLSDHHERVDEILWRNRSYIFFREAAVEDVNLGPVAAAKVQLVAGRSLAVDRNIHTFGFPFFVRSESITHMDDGRPFARLMLALDTGSAILGPARGDIFTGSGDMAGELAGAVRNAADFYILIPKRAASRYLS